MKSSQICEWIRRKEAIVNDDGYEKQHWESGATDVQPREKSQIGKT